MARMGPDARVHWEAPTRSGWRARLHFWRGIAHRHARPHESEHFEVVLSVADREDLRGPHSVEPRGSDGESGRLSRARLARRDAEVVEHARDADALVYSARQHLQHLGQRLP